MRFSLLVASLWLVTSTLQGKIVFDSKRDGNLEIYTMGSDGRHQTRLTHHPAPDWNPVWSPNGRQIAFSSERDGNEEVYVMDAEGGNKRNLTRRPGIDGTPSWHPNGSQIAFVSDRGGKELGMQLDIFVMDADGGNVKQITRLESAMYPRWSPDGKRIAFEASIGQGRQVYVVNADGTHRFQVSNPVPNAGMFLDGWSPDGKKILYTKAINSRVDMAVPVIATLHPVGGGKVVKWEDVPLPQMSITTRTWGADGKSILFAGKPNLHWNIYRFRLGERELIQLTDNPAADAGPHEWDPRLSVQPQQRLLPLFWGEIKSNRLRH